MLYILKLQRKGHKNFESYSVIILEKKQGVNRVGEDFLGNYFPLKGKKKACLFINSDKLSIWHQQGLDYTKKLKKLLN